MTQDAVDELCELLDLEPIEVNMFRGVSPKEDRQRVFGGQVAGQALVAAGRTVEQGSVHSLHAYFLRPDDPDPDSLPTFKERMEPFKETLGDWYERDRPIDIRHVSGSPMERRGREPLPPAQQVWMRADGKLPDDPMLHA